MKKETMAREWSYIWCGDSAYNSRYDDLVDGYLAGFDAGQAQLLEQASGFEDWWDKERGGKPINNDHIPVTEQQLYKWEKEAWLASALHSAKLLAEKDEEIGKLKEESDVWKDTAIAHFKNLAEKDRELSQAKELIKEMRDAMNWNGHSFQSSRFFVEFICKNTDKIKALLDEE